MSSESKVMAKYFDNLDSSVNTCLKICNEAKSKGFDPEEKVDVVLAKNMAERVEGLISTVAPQIKGSGIVERIIELEKEYGQQDWRVANFIALEVTQEKFCKFSDKREAMEVGLRIGLAYITVGVVASPLEGFVKLELKKRKDGKGEYFALFFSGPIRSAGTTATCIFVALADYVRRNMGYAAYDPTQDEIKRMSTELIDFHERVTNLQYFPTAEEIEFMTKSLPVQIDGDPSEKVEVSNYKDLDRIETNRLRNGVCLVMAEGLCQKAAKFWGRYSKWNNDIGMESWVFLDDFVNLQKKIKAKGKVASEDGKEVKVKPDYTFIKDLVAGRPVFSHPLAVGGFRIRYGRCRNSGFSAQAIHPATMFLLNHFIAIGTQLKVERPGKACVIGSCDSVEGPVVKLKNGSVVLVENENQAKKIAKDIEEIIFLGDTLINYGDFFNRAHILLPPGYCEEWWFLEVKRALEDKKMKFKDLGFDFFDELEKDPIHFKINAEQAIIISEKLGVPLHPRYTYHWKDISIDQFLSLINWLEKASIQKSKIIFPSEYDIEEHIEKDDPKRVLELIGVPHKCVGTEHVIIEGDDADAFAASLGFYSHDLDEDLIRKACLDKKDVLDLMNSISEVKLRDKSGYFMGARMGRPEKAKMRKLDGSPQVLFPVGKEGGKMRCFQSALEKGHIVSDFATYYCDKCKKDTIYPICENCSSKTTKVYYCPECMKNYLDNSCEKHGDLKPFKSQKIDIEYYFKKALDNLNIKDHPELIKGVRGTSNEDHFPEHLCKGLLRAKHNIYVNKDGTTRYDMTEMTITHFKPKEIGTSIEVLRELGYTKDIYGKDLVKDDQILELKVQDVILPSCDDALEEGADLVLYRVTKFIDDLLVKLYGVKPFYNLKNKKDLAGHLIIGLSPHTSAGIVGRIIGFSKTQGFLTSPLFHSIMRRDCDGDEAGVMLLMDAFLNFSRKFLPAHRGAKQDEPLVLTSKLIPGEVDDMVFDMDTCWSYPLEFYQACLEYKYPWDVEIERFKSRLGKESQYEGLGFTHDTVNINNGVRCSAYKSIPSMQEKVYGQMDLAEKIRAVDEVDVASLVIERHFVRDIKGNLRKFSMQQFRCVDCNSKFRRPPLVGKCTNCGGRIIFTIAEGSVIKYLEPSLSLAEKYDLPPYLRQTLELTKLRIESVFGKEDEKQEGLGRWFDKKV